MSYHDLLPSISRWWWWCFTLLSIVLSTLLFKRHRLFFNTRSANSETASGVLVSGSDTASPQMTQVNTDSQGYDYEVFLCFRGPDTRRGYTDHLYGRLIDAGIHVFRDKDEVRVGEDIYENLQRAITRSKISIPIFSKGFASSPWCLKEAAHIVKCKNTRNQLVLPIFYDVTRHQVTHQSGTYQQAFKKHLKHYGERMVQEWRTALAEIGCLKGWELRNGFEGELVTRVVSKVRRILNKEHLIVEDPTRVEEVTEMLQVGGSDVRIVGIYGIDGIGKTTLAKMIYNLLLECFDCSSLLRDVRERSSQPRGLEKLQSQLASDILKFKDQCEFPHVDEGVRVLSQRLQNKKVLMLLGDVDKKDQINALAGDLNWFGGGSRIVITTRDRHVFDLFPVKGAYEVSRSDSLVCWSSSSGISDTASLEMTQANGNRSRSLSSSHVESVDGARVSTVDYDLDQPNFISSSNLRIGDYEIFLSFRGLDTRTGFTDHLYIRLVDAGVRVFRNDEELCAGEEIGYNVVEAIKQSRISIPILSKDYASSKWCLKEAAHIVECKKTMNQLVLPIFYDVTLTQVRNQSGTYEEAFKQHLEHYDEETVHEWRTALAEIGSLNGWELQSDANGFEGELVKRVFSKVWRELNKAHPIVNDPITRVEEVMKMLHDGGSDVRIVGIYGIGGIDKTTFAKMIHDQLLERFDCSSFLKDVRERSLQPWGLEKLQSQLASDILKFKDQREFPHVDEGVQVLSQRLQNKKVLILLLDVDKKGQINALAGDLNWFGGGSRIVITTRDRHVFDGVPVKGAYEVSRSDSLVCWSSSSGSFDSASPGMTQVNTPHSTPSSSSYVQVEPTDGARSTTTDSDLNQPDSNSNPSRPMPHSASATADPQVFDYDVYLSFRGSDTRAGFADHLYTRLVDAGIRVVRDIKDLRVGEEIIANLLKAITQSRISIPILSKGFASSEWCLREVVQMVECRKSRNQLVLPIFYDVTRHQVTHQSGTYREAFEQYLKCYDKERVLEWRGALAKIGGLNGWELRNDADGHKGELVTRVVSKVWRELNKAHLIVKDPIMRVEEVMEMLQDEGSDVRIVGIYGIGGIDNTTLAKMIYNLLLEHFDCSSFLRDVRERSLQPWGLEKLQSQLASDILKFKDQREFHHVDEGVQVLSQRFRNKKVLILLDDVDKKDQISALVGGVIWFGGGSRIIITTRDKHVFDVSPLKGAYEVSRSNSLVCWSSFSIISDTASFEMIQANADHSRPLSSSHVEPTDGARVRTIDSDLDQRNFISNSNLPIGDYEVFLSFRGLDTQAGFADHLYIRLVDAGIRVFRNNEELCAGEEIGYNVVGAIKRSLISIPIFSEDYASSIWCLKEVAHMVECRNTINQLVLPIFYDVTGNQVRRQSGTYEEAFKQHLEHYGEGTVHEWRTALAEIGSLRGWELWSDANGNEAQIVRRVVEVVLRALKRQYLVVSDCIAGLEDSVNQVMELLDAGTNDVRIVGIHGMGGIGKTTLAKVVYNRLVEYFDRSSFLPNIRERSQQHGGLVRMQNNLVSDLLSVDLAIQFAFVDEGVKVLSERFQNKKVLILLDDVDHDNHLNSLAASINWFGPGSRIIVTSRNRDVLSASQVTGTYEASELQFKDALILFCRHAFRRDSPPLDYRNLSSDIVSTTGGLPLALEVVGSLLCGKSMIYWEGVSHKLKKIPQSEVGIKLRISFEALDYMQQQIFLDIACFFAGTDLRIAAEMWDSCGFDPHDQIEVLKARSLVKIVHNNKLWMHDLLKDLGRDIVRQENLQNPGARSRLWNNEETIVMLSTRMGTDKIEAMRADGGTESEDLSFTTEQFRDLSRLRFLRLDRANIHGDFTGLLGNLRWLQWHYCPVKLSSTNLYLMELVILDLSESDITDEWNGWISVQTAVKLRDLILRSCRKLTETPDFSRFPKLQVLNLENCTMLECIGPSIGNLKNLTFLSLKYCSGLESLPQDFSYLESLVELCIDGTCIREIPTVEGLKRLEMLTARECKSLTHIPPSIGQLTSLLELLLDGSGVKELPDSIGKLVKLRRLSMNRCKSLEKLPDSIGQLESLKELYLSQTCSVCRLPDSVGWLKNLVVLNVVASSITCLPSSLGMSERLEFVYASSCKYLSGKIFPDQIPSSLRALKLDGTNISELSASITGLPHLQTLDLTGCRKLHTIPDLPSSLRILSVTCKSLVTFRNLSCLVNLEELHLRCESLVEVPRDIGKLSKLKKLSMDRLNISELPKDIGILYKLKELAIKDCEKLEHIPDLPPGLHKLAVKGFSAHMFPDLSNLKDLLELKLSYCIRLERIPGLDRLVNLTMLSLTECDEIEELDGLEKLESLRDLHIWECESLEKLPDLSLLKQLRYLVTHGCQSLRALPDLSGLKLLRHLNLSHCEKLYMLEGLEELESLESLDISECKEIEDLPTLSKLQKLRDLNAEGCEKLKVIEGLEKIESQVSVYIYGCTSLPIIRSSSHVEIQREKRHCPRPVNIPDISAEMI